MDRQEGRHIVVRFLLHPHTVITESNRDTLICYCDNLGEGSVALQMFCHKNSATAVSAGAAHRWCGTRALWLTFCRTTQQLPTSKQPGASTVSHCMTQSTATLCAPLPLNTRHTHHCLQSPSPAAGALFKPHPGAHTLHCAGSLDMGYSVVEPCVQGSQVAPAPPGEKKPTCRQTLGRRLRQAPRQPTWLACQT